MGRVREVVEEILTQQSQAPQVLTGTTATFGTHIDCQSYESVMMELNVGAAFNAPATLSAILYEDSANGPDTSMVPVTLANFGVITGTGQNQKFVGGIASKNFKRYLALRIQANAVGGVNPTVPLSANMLLGKAELEVVPNSPTFKLIDNAQGNLQ
jgi:hypothetical protein